jgi:hypothetical protein
MRYSAGELGAERGVGKPLVAPYEGVLLPFATGSSVAVKDDQKPPLLAAIK